MPNLKPIIPRWRDWWDGLLSLLFPEYCRHCGQALNQHEQFLCRPCLSRLPATHFENNPVNPVVQSFWGRVPVDYATSLYHFRKGEVLQNLLHQLKYRNQPEVGQLLGRISAQRLIRCRDFPQPDCLIPVPLHPLKEKQRGYNQSLLIARGMAEVLQLPIMDQVLIRRHYKPSQTRKTRYERWENVKDAFALSPAHPDYTHLMLVDDVLTTGATLEACCRTLNQIPGAKISIVTVGFASK